MAREDKRISYGGPCWFALTFAGSHQQRKLYIVLFGETYFLSFSHYRHVFSKLIVAFPNCVEWKFGSKGLYFDHNAGKDGPSSAMAAGMMRSSPIKWSIRAVRSPPTIYSVRKIRHAILTFICPVPMPEMLCTLLSTTFEETSRGSRCTGYSYIRRVLNLARPPNWWQYRGSCLMSWCSRSLGGWALLRWARQAACSSSETLCREIWRIGTTTTCSIWIEKRESRWPHYSYCPWIYQHPSILFSPRRLSHQRQDRTFWLLPLCE